MAKSSRRSVLKSLKKTTSKAIPLVDEGLKTIGSTAKNVAVKSIPIVEKGVSAVYGTMASGFDLGVKGVARGVKSMSKKRHSKRAGKGKRKTRRH